jgi:protocatechuate 3,4-dioxygenase beta subunit
MNRIKKTAFALLSAVLFSTLLAVPLYAQQITATLTGTITDPNGAVVPGAIVTATSVETGQSKTATTGEEGNYTIPFLPPGTYNVTIAKTGFADSRARKHPARNRADGEH